MATITKPPDIALTARSPEDVSPGGKALCLWHIYTGTVALTLGALFGLLQGFSRANFLVMPPWFDYYRTLTAHGVLMALVFTTFFITGFLTYATYTTIPRVRSTKLNWTGYCVMLAGTLMGLAIGATLYYLELRDGAARAARA